MLIILFLLVSVVEPVIKSMMNFDCIVLMKWS